MTPERVEIPSGVKFVYFDVGNVLFSFQGGLESLSKKFNVPLASVKEYWRSQDDDICRGKLTPQQFWNNSKVKFGYSGEDMDFVNFWINHFSKIQQGHDLAIKLSKNFQLGLLTNAYPNVINRVINTDLMPKIKWMNIVQSCDLGFVKPERESYLM